MRRSRQCSQEEFAHIHDWMTDWGLLGAESDYGKMVDEEMRTGIGC